MGGWRRGENPLLSEMKLPGRASATRPVLKRFTNRPPGLLSRRFPGELPSVPQRKTSGFNAPAPPTRRVTLAEVAQAAGVSSSAASLALRDSPEIGHSTRLRVQAVAESLGYRPNPMAVGMAHRRQTAKAKPVAAALAWLNAWPVPMEMRRHREFELYWKGACRTAENFGYRVEEFVVSEKMPLQRVDSILFARNIRGILIPPQQGNPPIWEKVRWKNFSTVCISRRLDPPFAHVVTSAQAANAMLAFDRMRALGYERIAFLGPPARQRMWGAGFALAQAELPPERQIPPFLMSAADSAETLEALRKWIDEYRPEAILTEERTLPTMLKRLGLRVPEDIALAATSVLDEPGIDAGIYQNSEEIGRVAALTLISLIHEHDCGMPSIHREILIKGDWVDGGSLPPRPRGRSPHQESFT